jgi:hypothetical protein
MEGITLILAISILGEALVEYAKSVYDFFENKEFKKGITQLITILLGVLLAYAFGVDIFVTLGITVETTIGTFLTGIIISRGANYVSDLISKLGR